MTTTEGESMFVGFMTGFISIAVAGVLMTTGAVLSEEGNIERGKNAGIIYCTERPKQCATEYNYLKLKEAKK
jgi:hypothetical protein